MKLLKNFMMLAVMLAVFVSCKSEKSTDQQVEFKVDYEKMTLDNGLNVIFHIDRSDPVVAVALTTHVGSARELEGRTGFAHLFEHLLFLESENLGKGGLDKMSARIGGSGANGSTNRDITNYFQTVPKDALEKMIWAEADKLGYFINTVTEPVLAKEKQVVKNEKRQRVDNNPYGHSNYIVSKNLYPKGHPYSWTVIGSLEDLQNATLQDVKDFYNKWYVPNNVTLTIAGDFDMNQAKEWVKKYFDEIPRGEDLPAMEKQMVTLENTKKLYYEDNFARLPRLTLSFPGVHSYHEDSYALQVLGQYLSNGKQAPLYRSVVADAGISDNAGAYHYGSEIAGQFGIDVVAYSGTTLDDVYAAIEKGLKIFETEGISEEDLNKIKAGQETRFYNGLSSVLGKGFQLAQYEILAGDASYINSDIKKMLAVTPEDVMRVYNTYIKDKNYVAVNIVPKGQANLIQNGAELADVVEEKIVDGAEETFDASIAAEYERTSSSFDRTIEPPYGESPDVIVPEVWEAALDSGIKLYGIENHEVPLVQFQLQLVGGMLLDEEGKIGTANILGDLMSRGTATKTPEAFESAVEKLGSSINTYGTKQGIFIAGTTLTKNYDKTMALVEELILQPRWDETEFDLIKKSTLSQIERQKAQPNSIAANEFNKLIYGEENLMAQSSIGTSESVEGITMEDLKNYFDKNIVPNVVDFHVVGSISQGQVEASLANLNSNWNSKEVVFPAIPDPEMPTEAKVYFYDVPGAKQSVINFGNPALAATDDDYYKASLLNYRLGGGSFASQLTQELREGKGYTYGVRSGFSGTNYKGTFRISSGVRSNVTYEATALVKEIVENYGAGFNEKDLEVTKGYMIKSKARAFETLRSKLNMLTNISNYGYPHDYAKQQEEVVKAITVDDIKALAEKYLHADKMIYLIVGDAETQLDKLNGLGFGAPVLLNP